MNFCTKCQSIYSQPGTCNCFAQTAPCVQPVVPITPYVPTYPPYTPWWQSPFVTITGTPCTTTAYLTS